MSITSEIQRLKQDKITIKNKLIAMGIGQADDGFDEIATEISEISFYDDIDETVAASETYTIPQGYHDGNGVITGTGAGANEVVLQALTVTPSDEEQFFSPETDESETEFDGYSSVTVNAIPDIYQDVSEVDAEAEDVLSGKTIVDSTGGVINGAMSDNGDVTDTFDGIDTLSVTIPEGYTSGGTISLTSDIENVLAAF